MGGASFGSLKPKVAAVSTTVPVGFDVPPTLVVTVLSAPNGASLTAATSTVTPCVDWLPAASVIVTSKRTLPLALAPLGASVTRHDASSARVSTKSDF